MSMGCVAGEEDAAATVFSRNYVVDLPLTSVFDSDLDVRGGPARSLRML